MPSVFSHAIAAVAGPSRLTIWALGADRRLADLDPRVRRSARASGDVERDRLDLGAVGGGLPGRGYFAKTSFRRSVTRAAGSVLILRSSSPTTWKRPSRALPTT